MAYMIIIDDKSVINNTSLLLAVAGIVLVAVIAVLMIGQTRRRLAEQAAQNERNQAALVQLLDEIADLAEGDLRIQASVTENFTGAIADSINFAIDQMRALVSNINSISRQVAKAAGETEGTAANLAAAAESQAREIGAASQAINEMAAPLCA